MNSAIVSLFNQYHGLAGSPEAAATLVLAQVQADERTATLGTPNDGLLDLKASAVYLGYDAAGLRKIVNQQKIQYVQNGRGPIKFRREWLDIFIASNAAGPKDIERSPATKRIRSAPAKSVSKFGFDPKLYQN